jgi:hypothetical protein
MLIYYEKLPVTVPITPEWSQLVEDFSYWSERLDGKHTITRGFEFDWDSIKRWKTIFYWWLKGRTKVAALIHDELYYYGVFNGRKITRLEADQVFLDAMIEEMRQHREHDKLTGFKLKHREFADLVRRTFIYYGVRVGGQHAWDDYRALD